MEFCAGKWSANLNLSVPAGERKLKRIAVPSPRHCNDDREEKKNRWRVLQLHEASHPFDTTA